MSYGIMRIEKRHRGDVKGLQMEANRKEEQHKKGLDFDQSDIDWSQTDRNIFLVKSADWLGTIDNKIKEIDEQTGKKTRKDAVVMLDGLFTASPEFFEGKNPEEIQKYFEDCLDFYVQEFCQGDRSRVINAVIHLDETTPHMQIASIPILSSEAGDKLSAKVIMGGVKDYRQHQDHFYSDVSAHYGLERGETRESAETKAHTTKREWQIAKQQEALDKNAEVLQRQVEQYNAAKEAIEEQGRILQDTKDKIETLSNEALQSIKVNRASDLFNRDTVTVDRESYDSLTKAVKVINKETETIAAAENISQKKAELKAINKEIATAKKELSDVEFDRDNVKAEYEMMQSYISDNKSGLALRIENSQLQSENKKLKEKNSLLIKTLDIIKKIAQEHPSPVSDFIINKITDIAAPEKTVSKGRQR